MPDGYGCAMIIAAIGWGFILLIVIIVLAVIGLLSLLGRGRRV
jgi:hypothetical protein